MGWERRALKVKGIMTLHTSKFNRSRDSQQYKEKGAINNTHLRKIFHIDKKVNDEWSIKSNRWNSKVTCFTSIPSKTGFPHVNLHVYSKWVPWLYMKDMQVNKALYSCVASTFGESLPLTRCKICWLDSSTNQAQHRESIKPDAR